MVSTKEQAHRIALNLREQGRGPKGGPGRLRSVQGIGWWLAEHNIAQGSDSRESKYFFLRSCNKKSFLDNMALCGIQIDIETPECTPT